MGILEAAGDGWHIRPADRRIKADFYVPAGDRGDADRGDLVLAEVRPSHRLGLARAKVSQRLGRPRKTPPP